MSAAHYLNHFEDLWLCLKPFRPIAFGTRLARITGHPKGAILLSQMVYWTRRGRDVGDNGGWIHKTREHWRIETGLSRDEQEGVRARLRNLNLVSEWRGGRPACLHCRTTPSADEHRGDARGRIRSKGTARAGGAVQARTG